MSEKRVALDSEAKIVSALDAAVARQAVTPAAQQFLETATMTDANNYNVNYIKDINLRDAAQKEQGERVAKVDAKGIELVKLNVAFLNEMNGHISIGQNPRSVRKFFGLDEATGNLPDMDSEDKLILVSKKIISGNAATAAAGNVVNTGFQVNLVVTMFGVYAGLVTDKDTQKGLVGDAEVAVNNMTPLAKATCDDIATQCKFKFRKLTDAQMRDKCRLWGVDFETEKTLTKISIQVMMPDGTTVAAGAEGRIGAVFTKNGKIAKEGVTGKTNVLGDLVLETSTDGDTSLIVRLLNCADNITPIKIVAGTAQTFIINLVAGVSSL